jgi:hypothetical protein
MYWSWRQGGVGIFKKDLGSNFFFQHQEEDPGNSYQIPDPYSEENLKKIRAGLRPVRRKIEEILKNP